ncbi:embryonic protein UVS.2-like [Ascaphus truei]|uniref:embryonic protein UVS.2-like n=1 Tax=Ascaphus truei TaxID=8439 RepID=UPI003F5999B3
MDTTNPTEDVMSTIEQMNKGITKMMRHGDIALKGGRSSIRCPSGKCFWPKTPRGVVNVPYTLSAEYTTADRSSISAAMLEFATMTCVRFVPRTNEADYLQILSDSGCWSFMGRSGGAQVVSLQRGGCLAYGVIQHELNHALGFEHEHCRSDRDSYVKIMWNNIMPDNMYNFNKSDTNNLGLEYDYSSVMHYGKYAFSTDYIQASINPIPNNFTPIGQRYGLSNLDVAKINKLYNCSVCSSLLSSDSGSFFSAFNPSNYPNNYNCSWLIRIPRDRVFLQFQAFDVQLSKGCTSDYIRVFDGASRTSPVLLDSACGKGQLPSLVASGNLMLVELVSDESVTATGFRALYSTVTCGGTMTAKEGSFSSPGYEQHELYPPYSDCTWTIIAPVGFKVQLNFIDFNLEKVSSCSYDYLEIRDGLIATSPMLGTHCGTESIPTIISSSNGLLLKFHSDSSQESSGFLAKYSFVPRISHQFQPSERIEIFPSTVNVNTEPARNCRGGKTRK